MAKQQRFALEVSYNLGVAYYEKANYWAYDKAEEAFQKVIDGSEETPKKQAYRDLLSLAHSGLVAIAAQRSTKSEAELEILWKQGQIHYQNAISLVSKDSEIYVQARYSLSLLYHFNRKDFDKAKTILQEVLCINPYHWRAYTTLGQMAIAEKRVEEAISYLKKATNLAPDFEFAYYQLGHAYSQLKKTDLAINAYSKALDIAGAHVGWGRVLALQKKDYRGAVAQFKQAVELNSQNAEAYADLAWYLAEGQLLTDEPTRQQAIDAAELAVKLTNYNDWRKLGTLGRIYFECGQIQRAQETLEKARNIKSDAPHVHYYQACIDLEERQYEQAKAHLITIFQLEQNEEIKYWREKANSLMDKVKRALLE